MWRTLFLDPGRNWVSNWSSLNRDGLAAERAGLLGSLVGWDSLFDGAVCKGFCVEFLPLLHLSGFPHFHHTHHHSPHFWAH